MNEEYPSVMSVVVEKVKKIGKLYLEDAKLNVTEKLSLVISAVVMVMACFLLGIALLICLALCAASALESVLAPVWSFLIVGGIFAILIAVLLLLKEQIVVNPITKFVSKMLLNAPKENVKDEKE